LGDNPSELDGIIKRSSAKAPLMSICGKAVPFPLNFILWIPMAVALLVAGLLSIPATKVWYAIMRRQERRFALKMKAKDKLFSWDEACSRVERGNGYLISDHFSIKGPIRLWWTAEDVLAVSPYPYILEESPELIASPNAEFIAWCRCRYTNPQSGAAVLVELREPESQRERQVLTQLSGQYRHFDLWPLLTPDYQHAHTTGGW
jgi:hypothetical protein